VQNGTFSHERFIDTQTVRILHRSGVPTHLSRATKSAYARIADQCSPSLSDIANVQGQKVADAIGAKAYFETSALLNTGVDAVFESATRAAVLVRDQGHGGIGAQYDRTGNERRDSYRPKEKEGRCCVIA
jgi:hypothetical protein